MGQLLALGDEVGAGSAGDAAVTSPQVPAGAMRRTAAGDNAERGPRPILTGMPATRHVCC